MNKLSVEERNKRICFSCGSNKTDIKPSGVYRWLKKIFVAGLTLWFCNRCYHKYISNPIRNPINNSKQLYYGKKRILLYRNPRTGYCSNRNCDNNVFDKSCKITAMHHALGYFPIFVWFGIIELCPSCHRKTH